MVNTNCCVRIWRKSTTTILFDGYGASGDLMTFKDAQEADNAFNLIKRSIKTNCLTLLEL